MAGLHSAGSVVFVKPHGCFDTEELSSRSDRFIPNGWTFFSAGWDGACHGQTFTCGDVSDSQSTVQVPGILPGSWRKCLWRNLGGNFRPKAACRCFSVNSFKKKIAVVSCALTGHSTQFNIVKRCSILKKWEPEAS